MTTKAPKDAILQAPADESDQKMLGFLNEPASWPLGGKAQFVCGIKPFGRFQR